MIRWLAPVVLATLAALAGRDLAPEPMSVEMRTGVGWCHAASADGGWYTARHCIDEGLAYIDGRRLGCRPIRGDLAFCPDATSPGGETGKAEPGDWGELRTARSRAAVYWPGVTDLVRAVDADEDEGPLLRQAWCVVAGPSVWGGDSGAGVWVDDVLVGVASLTKRGIPNGSGELMIYPLDGLCGTGQTLWVAGVKP